MSYLQWSQPAGTPHQHLRRSGPPEQADLRRRGTGPGGSRPTVEGYGVTICLLNLRKLIWILNLSADEFRLLLAQNRVGKADLYSEGEWQRDRKRVRLRRTAGKWNLYGYMEDKVHYLDGYEALHLMEMVSLDRYFLGELRIFKLVRFLE